MVQTKGEYGPKIRIHLSCFFFLFSLFPFHFLFLPLSYLLSSRSSFFPFLLFSHRKLIPPKLLPVNLLECLELKSNYLLKLINTTTFSRTLDATFSTRQSILFLNLIVFEAVIKQLVILIQNDSKVYWLQQRNFRAGITIQYRMTREFIFVSRTFF